MAIVEVYSSWLLVPSYLGYTPAKKRWCLYATTLFVGMGVNRSTLSVMPLPDGELQGL